MEPEVSKPAEPATVTKPTAVQIQHHSTTVDGIMTVKHMIIGPGWTTSFPTVLSEVRALEVVQMDRPQLPQILRKFFPPLCGPVLPANH